MYPAVTISTGLLVEGIQGFVEPTTKRTVFLGQECKKTEIQEYTFHYIRNGKKFKKENLQENRDFVIIQNN